MGTARQAKRAARRAYRKARRLSKKVLAKKYANTVGQIVRRKPGRRVRPSRGRSRRRRRY